MATLALQKVGDGLDVAFSAAAAGGDDVPAGVELGGWSLPVLLLVANGDVAAHTVTVGDLAPLSVAAGGTGAVQVSAGVYHGSLVPVTYDAVTSVTVAAVDLSE